MPRNKSLVQQQSLNLCTSLQEKVTNKPNLMIAMRTDGYILYMKALSSEGSCSNRSLGERLKKRKERKLKQMVQGGHPPIGVGNVHFS